MAEGPAKVTMGWGVSNMEVAQADPRRMCTSSSRVMAGALERVVALAVCGRATLLLS